MPRADKSANALRAFYLETIRPDVERIVQGSEERLRSEITEFRRDIDSHFDALYQRLDRLETEYHMLVQGLRRVEQAIGDDKKDRPALRTEVAELRASVAALAERVRELEAKVP